MDARRDALVAGARLVLAVREAARDERSRATVGAIAVRPAIPTAVPGVVRARRSTSAIPTPATLAAMVGEVHDAAAQIAVDERVEMDFERIWSIAPVAFDERRSSRSPRRRRAEVTGGSARLFSGALHDAAAVASTGVPAVMLFVQSAAASATRARRTPRPSASRPACGRSRA